jgi:TusA-related sulfurtransferase
VTAGATGDHEGAGMAPAPVVVLDLGTAEEMCGDPALGRVRRAWAELAPGGVIEVRTPIAEQAFAVRGWARREGAELLADAREGAVHVLRVRRAP